MELPALRRSELPVFPLLLAMALAVSWAGAAQAAAAAAAAAPSPSLPPSPAPAPAPAPAPEFVNITQVLVYAGDFSTFLSLLTSTGVLEKFQKQANDTDVGITIFAPKSKAFTAQPAAALLKNLTGQQLQSLLEYHALTSYQSLTDLQQASDNETSTFAGAGGFDLNITTVVGQVQIVTDWNRATIATTLYDSLPCSIFALDQVLLPEALFGLPAPAPAPSPFSGEPAATPSSPSSPGSSSAASGPSASNKSFASRPSSPSPLHSLLLFLPLLLFKLL